MGWGADLIGYRATVTALEALKFEFGDGAIFVVGPTVNYAVYHELGTAKMEARPFARPAAERVQANLSSKVEEYLEEPVTTASEEAIVRSAALALESEMKRIVKDKDIWDTGTLHGSISVEKVS